MQKVNFYQLIMHPYPAVEEPTGYRQELELVRTVENVVGTQGGGGLLQILLTDGSIIMANIASYDEFEIINIEEESPDAEVPA